jgi:hypothetical protein
MSRDWFQAPQSRMLRLIPLLLPPPTAASPCDAAGKFLFAFAFYLVFTTPSQHNTAYPIPPPKK